MTPEQNPHDFYVAINDVRRDAREHTDTVLTELRQEARRDRERTESLVSELRDEAREDRRETLAAISSGRQEVLAEVRASRHELRDDINALSTRVQTNSDQILRILTYGGAFLTFVTLAIAISGIIIAMR